MQIENFQGILLLHVLITREGDFVWYGHFSGSVMPIVSHIFHFQIMQLLSIDGESGWDLTKKIKSNIERV